MPKRSYTTLFVALCLTACPAPSDKSTVSSSITTSTTCTAAGVCFEVADALDFAEACPLSRIIAVSPSPGVCPALTAAPTGGSWAIGPLMPGAAGALGKYCVYQWSSATGVAPDTGVLPAVPYGPDCAVVSGMGPTAPLASLQTLETAFLDQVEAVTSVTLAGAPTPIKVSVIDSAVRSPPPHSTAGILEHGRDMQLLIDRLACPTPGVPFTLCAPTHFTTLALKMRENNAGEAVRDEVNGGEWGSQGDLAFAIQQAVDDMLAAPGPNRLLLNLSVAWDPEWGGTGASSVFSPPVAAVYEALQYASCHGALAFAASGNRRGGPFFAGGPGFPAGWESKDQPTVAECAAKFGVAGPPTSVTTYRPLLYAVGAVDGADHLAANARAQSRPILVAPGTHMTLEDHWTAPTGDYIDVHSGSSVAAAVASAAAAMTWSLAPGRSAHDIADILRSSAIGLVETSDFQNTHSDYSRRISICQAVAAICPASAVCAASPVCPAPIAYRDANPSGLTHRAPDHVANGALLTSDEQIDAPCNSLNFYAGISYPDAPCPANQFYEVSAVPWVWPHGGNSVCSVCSIEGNTIFIEISNDLEGILTDPTVLMIYTDQTEKRYNLDLPASALEAGSVVEIDNAPEATSDVGKVVLEFVLDDDKSTSDTLIIDNNIP